MISQFWYLVVIFWFRINCNHQTQKMVIKHCVYLSCLSVFVDGYSSFPKKNWDLVNTDNQCSSFRHFLCCPVSRGTDKFRIHFRFENENPEWCIEICIEICFNLNECTVNTNKIETSITVGINSHFLKDKPRSCIYEKRT